MSDNIERLYRFIKQHIQQHGFAPSVREMAQALSVSRTSIARYLDRLEDLERLTREPGVARGIALRDERD